MGELVGYPSFAKSLSAWQVSPKSASLTSVNRLLGWPVWRLTSTFINLTSEIRSAETSTKESLVEYIQTSMHITLGMQFSKRLEDSLRNVFQFLPI